MSPHQQSPQQIPVAYMTPPARQRNPAAILFWSLCGAFGFVTIIALLVLLIYQPNALADIACGLGNQDACQQEKTVAIVRFVVLCVGISSFLAAIVSFINALIFTLRGRP